MKKSLCCLFLINIFIPNLLAKNVSEKLEEFNRICVRQDAREIASHCANLLSDSIEGTTVHFVKRGTRLSSRSLYIDIADPDDPLFNQHGDQWIFIRLPRESSGRIVSSSPNLLYTATRQLLDDWCDYDLAYFENGHVFYPSFEWVEGNDGFFASRLYFSLHYESEQSVEEFTRIGCTHVPVNALASPYPYEQGPPGEHYYRFYITNPDLDQFVDTELNRGLYPPEYLAANRRQMEKNLRQARRYGIRPGLAMCAPRSVPEAFFSKYPQLRGARIDHPFHSFKPRYTMTLAHPLARWHYADMMKKLMRLYPDLDYAYVWSNDSGSGFEHTMTTYPGRNGGAFLVREWRTNEQIAGKAAENIYRYLKILQNAGSAQNDAFRTSIRIFSFPAAGDTLLNFLEEGYDIRMLPSSIADSAKRKKLLSSCDRGAKLSTTVSLAIPYSHVAGLPFPWVCRKRLQDLMDSGIDRISLTVHPQSLVPRDINREVFRKYQFEPGISVDSVVAVTAGKWVGRKHRQTLIDVWKLTDQTVEKFPYVPLYQGYGFVSFRLWARPLVPNIEAIPKQKRAYYEDYMLSTFYNPALVDLSKNALWTLVPVDVAGGIVDACDSLGVRLLENALNILNRTIADPETADHVKDVFIDQRDRIRGLVCYYKTLENTARWIVGVHGYLRSDSEAEKRSYRQFLHDMMSEEIENMQRLLDLWNTSQVTFMPVSKYGEDWYTYGENFGEVLKKKIDLMTAHMHDEPFIDPDFMWRMQRECPVEPERYLNMGIDE
jgi:hypothetical protein